MTRRAHLTIGLDVGTSAVKVAVLASDAGTEHETLALAHQRIRRRNVVDVVRATFEEACSAAGATPRDFDYVCTTGDAEDVAAALGFEDGPPLGHLYGMTTHAKGALALAPEARAVLDLGALHARAIKMDGRGRVLGHRMTSQCASGTGQFLENIARYLGVPLEDVGGLSLRSHASEETSSICAVLAETDVINMVSRGVATEDILKGIHLSIAWRLAKLVRAIGAGGTVLLTGGLAHDVGLTATINEVFAEDGAKKRPGVQPVVATSHAHSIHAGAFGAALLGAYRVAELRARPRQPMPVAEGRT